MSRHNNYLALRHYSSSKPITCSLISGTPDNFFTIRLNDNFDLFDSVNKGDPVTFGKLENNKEARIFGGFVLSKAENNELTISPDMISCTVERRHSKRYPVSILGYVSTDCSKRSLPPYLSKTSAMRACVFVQKLCWKLKTASKLMPVSLKMSLI